MNLRALFSATWGHFVRTSKESPRRDGSSAPAVVDLFLSYNSRDRAAVQQVRTLLGARGLSVFFDCEDLRAGLFWFEALQQALGQVRGVAVFLGPNGLGRWQRYEMALALDRQTKEPTFPVIPVPLPGSRAGDYSGFLLVNTFVDLRSGLDDPAALDRIEQAVRGTMTVAEPDLRQETAALCPYRALEPFREQDAPLFFGRDRFVINPDRPEQGLLYKARTCPLVAVVGASGSGKSSVVQAGLVPRLRREPPSQGTWDAVIFTLGKRPFHNLAAALVAVWNPDAGVTDRRLESERLGNALAAGELSLDGPFDDARNATRVNRLLIIVDQFEELFTETPEAAQRDFVTKLLAAADPTKVTVLLTLRADFYGRALELGRTLSDLMQRGIINVGAMTREERREAIERPARLVGLDFEHGLIERILDDVGDEPGNLPLLEFALTELWERRDGRRLTHEKYEALGRVAGAIGRRADSVYDSLTPDQQAAAPRLFGRLVRVSAADEQGADTRQRVRLRDLDPAARSVAEPFVKGRLLVASRDEPLADQADPAPPPLDDPTTIEVAHEALIRTWDRLRGWIKEDRAFLLWRQRLGFQIAEWERSDRDEGMLLRGALLKEAEDFKSRWDDLNNRERDFLTRPQAAAAQFRRAESRRLAAFSVSQRDKRLDLALLLATEALKAEPTFEARGNFLEALQPWLEEPLGRTTVEYWQTWGKHLQTFQKLTTLLTTPCNVVGVAFSPDGMALAAWYGSGVDLWHVAARTRLVEESLAVPEGEVREVVGGVAFSKPRCERGSFDYGVPEGGVGGGGSSTPLCWGGFLFFGWAGGGGGGGAAFSPEGKTLAAGYEVRSDHKDVAWSGGVVLWDVAARTRLVKEPLAVTGTGGRGVAFSPDGKVLAAGDSGFFSSSPTVRLWDLDLESWLCRAGEIANRNFTWAEWQQYFPDRPYSPTFPNLPMPPEVR